jgi:hypothetical protein
MWTRRRVLIQGGLAVLGAAGACFALPGDDGAARPDGPAIPDGSASRGMVTLAADTAVDRGLAFLYNRRGADGMFGSDGYEGNVAVTSLAALAFMAGGHQPRRGAYGKAVADTVRYVLKADTASGRVGFLSPARTTPHGPMYGHGFGTLFLAEVAGMVNEKELRSRVHEKLRQAVKVILEAQNREGGWRYDPSPDSADISVTVCQMMALRAARNAGVAVPSDCVKKCVDYVKRCQDRHSGGFNYMANGGAAGPDGFARTAAGLSALNSAGVYDGEEIERGLRFLVDNRPPAPGRGFGRMDVHYFYGHYYAVQAMWTAGGDYWARWYPRIRDELLECQQNDGSWIDGVCPHYATAMACIILQVPNNYLPILQK